MANENQTDDQDAMEGGIENIIHEVETGEEIEGEHPDQPYEFRQRIVNPDDAAKAAEGEQQPPSKTPPEPLPPAENP